MALRCAGLSGRIGARVGAVRRRDEAAIRAAEDRLRTLIFDTNSPDFWTTAIEPATGSVEVKGAGG